MNDFMDLSFLNDIEISHLASKITLELKSLNGSKVMWINSKDIDYSLSVPVALSSGGYRRNNTLKIPSAIITGSDKSPRPLTSLPMPFRLFCDRIISHCLESLNRTKGLNHDSQ